MANREDTMKLFHELSGLPEGKERDRLRNQLVEIHMPLAAYLAKKYRNRGQPLEDLEQVACMGLIRAVNRFDPDRGLEFSTFATPTIMGEVKRYFRDRGWMVKAPRRVQENKINMVRATEKWQTYYGAHPTNEELANYMGVTVEDVVEAQLSSNAYATASLDAPTLPSDDGQIETEPGYIVEDYESVEMIQSVKHYIKKLGSREQQILYKRFWEGKTQSQIAQELGISQMHVSRLLARTLVSLRQDVADPDS